MTVRHKTQLSRITATCLSVVEEESRGDAIATFVIRIRLEDVEATKQRQRWVGHITNVLEQREDWVHSLEDVRRYFKNELLRMGATPNG